MNVSRFGLAPVGVMSEAMRIESEHQAQLERARGWFRIAAGMNRREVDEQINDLCARADGLALTTGLDVIAAHRKAVADKQTEHRQQQTTNATREDQP